MTIFENFKNKDIDELVDWFSEHCSFDSAPYWHFWDEKYCSKCEPEITCVPDLSKDLNSDIECECAWCELNNKCKFFPNINDIPDEKQIIKMWLESEGEA